SAGTGNLTLSQGQVTDSSVSDDHQTVHYTLSGITQEGTLTVTLPVGAVTDEAGNPNQAFSASYALDIGSVPLAGSLQPVLPQGPTIYQGTPVSGIIDPPGDTDSFTLPLDPGQTLTVLVHPNSAGLQPTVQVTDPDGNPLGSAAASAAGGEALL